MNDLWILVWTQLWQVTLAILLVALVSLRWGRRYPHLIYVLWILVVVKTLVPPILSSQVSMFSWLDTAASAWPNESAVQRIEPESFVPSAPPPFDPNVVTTPDAADLSAPPPNAVAGPPPQARTEIGAFQATTLLTAIWAIGAFMLLSYATWHWLRLARIISTRSEETPTWVDSLVQRVRFKLGIKRQFKVVVNSAGVGPLVYGVFRPSLVLPAELLTVERRRRLEPVIAHEMIHARRGDTLFGLIQFFSQVVWWFHPLVWWANRQANRCCEQCCDEETVAGLNCRPEEYAHSLVDVLELRRRLRGVPALSGMKSAEVTKNRLEVLINRSWPFLNRTPRWHFLLLIICGLLMIPGGKIARGLDGSRSNLYSPGDVLAMRAQADREFLDGQWNHAVLSYQELLHHNPDDARSWFRMAYALHADGRLKEALTAHERAAEFPQIRPIATYNWACALALMGHDDAAMKKLSEAIDYGFRSQNPIQNDPDLVSLVDRPRFKELAQMSVPEGEQTVYGQFDFLIGTWNTYDQTNGKRIGRHRIHKDEQGFVVMEEWTNKDGSSGASKYEYDVESERWNQTRSQCDGSSLNLVGSQVDGKMVMIAMDENPDGMRHFYRMKYIPMPNGMIIQRIEESEDKGETWIVQSERLFERTKDSRSRQGRNRETVTFEAIY